jgi:hypothetical protein
VVPLRQVAILPLRQDAVGNRHPAHQADAQVRVIKLRETGENNNKTTACFKQKVEINS